MDKLLLTPVEAASALGIGRTKLYELLKTGALASVQIGTSRRVPQAALEALIADLWKSASVHRSTSEPHQRPLRAIASPAISAG
jgi:excisionase family DNA binding protein